MRWGRALTVVVDVLQPSLLLLLLHVAVEELSERASLQTATNHA